MKVLAFDEYMSMNKDDRKALRRRAFYHPAPLPPHLHGKFDLEALAELLEIQNATTGEFAGKWTDEDADAVDSLLSTGY